jgi:hypothetical protein
VFTRGFKIKERRKRAAIRKASVWVPQFIKERVNASFQLQYHNRKVLSIEYYFPAKDIIQWK